MHRFRRRRRCRCLTLLLHPPHLLALQTIPRIQAQRPKGSPRYPRWRPDASDQRCSRALESILGGYGSFPAICKMSPQACPSVHVYAWMGGWSGAANGLMSGSAVSLLPCGADGVRTDGRRELHPKTTMAVGCWSLSSGTGDTLILDLGACGLEA